MVLNCLNAETEKVACVNTTCGLFRCLGVASGTDRPLPEPEPIICIWGCATIIYTTYTRGLIIYIRDTLTNRCTRVHHVALARNGELQ